MENKEKTKYTASYIVRRRKEKWEELHDIQFDERLRNSIAKRIIEDEALRKEVIERPSYLVEMVFTVVNKEQQTVPFFFNEVQKDFIDKLEGAIKDFEDGKISNISFLILKGRQQGFTTVVTAYQLACCITRRNFQGFTLADVMDNSEAIFQNKAKFVFNNLPKMLKPTEKYSNRREYLFDKINSSWNVDTATKDVGRSRTINFFHGSECAFWKSGIAPVQSALGEAFTKNAIKIYESTANGFNDFKRMWDSKAHINCFYEWWRTPEYRVEFVNAAEKKEFEEKIEHSGDWIFERIKWLLDEKKLSLEQCKWYYDKYRAYLDPELIKQEYPCTPAEAFISSGSCVFNVEKINKRLAQVKKPIKTGYFEYDYDDNKPPYSRRNSVGCKISRIRWVSNPKGYIKIYKLPNSPEFTKYAIGGDTSGTGTDYNVGQVIDCKTLEQVAVLHLQTDSDIYAKQMYCLGMYYGGALIGIENNFDSFPLRELDRLGYPNQYIDEKNDTIYDKSAKRLGFRTDLRTRPQIIDYLKQLVREHVECINDEDTLNEMLEFVYTDQGRAEAQEGAHDDLVMALAIAYRITSQVQAREPVIQTPEKQFFNGSKNRRIKRGNDVTSRRVVI